MHSRDWKTISYIGLIIGIILIAGGLFAYSYEKTVWYYMVDYPFRQTGILLFVLGGIFFALSIFLLVRPPNKPNSENVRTNQ